MHRFFRVGALLAPFALASCSLLSTPPAPTPQVIVVTATPDPAASVAPTEAPPSQEPPEVAPTTAPAEPILAQVRRRELLRCGTNLDLPGFGFYDPVRAEWSGFDAEFCRVIAAAVLGDAEALEFVGLTTSGPDERFAAVRERRVDVAFRNSTWTLGRDASQIAFGPTTFYDGQTLLVGTDLAAISSLDEFDGLNLRVCVQGNTTSEQNLLDEFAAQGVAFTPVVRDDENATYAAYEAGECEAVTSDSSQLAARRVRLRDPEAHVVLGLRFSREPLGPFLPENDSQWFDVVSWAVFATIYAEELGVTQANVDEQLATSDDPRVRRLLGLEGELGAGLGLRPDFAYQIIRQVGNYAEIYERHLGEGSPFGIVIDRGPNKLAREGGLFAPPPFR